MDPEPGGDDCPLPERPLGVTQWEAPTTELLLEILDGLEAL